jgi:hypothetical protein
MSYLAYYEQMEAKREREKQRLRMLKSIQAAMGFFIISECMMIILFAIKAVTI